MTLDEKLYEFAGMSIKYEEAWDAYTENVGEEYASKEDFEESYNGEWDSELDFAEDLFDQCYESNHSYTDYDGFARDLFMGDYYSVNSDNGVFVFRNT